MLSILSLLAEAATDPNVPWNLFAPAAGTAFVGWLTWYLITNVIPNQQQECRNASEAQAERHQEAQAEIVNKFTDVVTQTRAEHRADMKECWGQVRENSKLMADAVNSLKDEIRRRGEDSSV